MKLVFVGQCQPWWCPASLQSRANLGFSWIHHRAGRHDETRPVLAEGLHGSSPWAILLLQARPLLVQQLDALPEAEEPVEYGGVWWSMVEYGGVWWSMVVWGADRWCRWCVLISKIANKTSYISSIKLLPESMWIISNTSPTPPTRNKIGPLQGLTLQRFAAAW